MEEVITEINKVGSLVSSDHQFSVLINKQCCETNPRYECKEHFLNPELKDTILKHLESKEIGKIANTANFVAELAKHDTGRLFLTDAAIVTKLVSALKDSNVDVLIQSCRALGNICYEKSEGQNLITDNKGAENVIVVLRNSINESSAEHKRQLQTAAVGLLLNLINDNKGIHRQVFNENLLETLMMVLRPDLSAGAASSISQYIFVMLVTLTETIPVSEIFTPELCNLAVLMFRNSFDTDFVITGLNFLEDEDVSDLVKVNLAKAGLFDLFLELLDKKGDNLTEADVKKYELTGRVLANILAGDEAMEHLYQKDDGKIVDHLMRWLVHKDTDLVHAAVLCIGNIARTDRHSTELVDRGLHQLLLEILKNRALELQLQHAVVSTIRNLSIPKVNKIRLVEAGVIPILLDLLSLELESSSPVIFKVLGTLRQLVDGNKELATELGSKKELVTRLVTWTESSGCPWVSSECNRLLCWFINISRERTVMRLMQQCGGVAPILRMLKAKHGLMQSEAVTALALTCAVTLAESEAAHSKEVTQSDKGMTKQQEEEATSVDTAPNQKQLDELLVENQVGEKVQHLLAHFGAKMELPVLENVLTFLEVAIKFDIVKKDLIDSGLSSSLRDISTIENFAKLKPKLENIKTSITA